VEINEMLAKIERLKSLIAFALADDLLCVLYNVLNRIVILTR